MGRTSSDSFTDLKDDEPYIGVLTSVKLVPSTREGWAPQLEIDLELRQGGKMRDWLPTYLNTKAKGPSTLRQFLNALGGYPKDEELWFDAETLEWGYDMKPESAPFLALDKAVGMPVQFRGEKPAKDKRYRITSYRSAPK